MFTLVGILIPTLPQVLLITPNLEVVLGRAEVSPQPINEGVSLTLVAISGLTRLPTSRQLAEPEVQAEIIRQVQAKVTPAQGTLGDMVKKPDVEAIVRKVTQAFLTHTIDIPRIVLTRAVGDDYNFIPFTLDTAGIGRLSPVDQEILIQHLRTHQRETLSGFGIRQAEDCPEDYLVSNLMDCQGVNYEQHVELLCGLAGQMTAYLRSYLTQEDEVLNVLKFHKKILAELIYTQMQKNLAPARRDFLVSEGRGFQTPKTTGVTCRPGEPICSLRHELGRKGSIRNQLFTGFKKCLYPIQKFDFYTERCFAVMLEDELKVLKWYKPGCNDFSIYYDANHTYEPDFVVEFNDRKILAETKMEKDEPK